MTVLEPAVIVLRFAQYVGAMTLFGGAAFLLYASAAGGIASTAPPPWSRRLLVWSAVLVFAGSILGLLAQTSVLAGSVAEGLTVEALTAVFSSMALGPSSVVRAGVAALALSVIVATRLGRMTLTSAVLLGAIILSSFAWMGHGAATRGTWGVLHLSADILHTLAAGIWFGALVAFYCLAGGSTVDPENDKTLHGALRGFAGLGTALVALLIATGAVNSWFLIGPSRVGDLWSSTYGWLLTLKVLLFIGMLAFAARNRFRLTPALGAVIRQSGSPVEAKTALRRSILLELTLANGVLALVAWLGRLAPIP